MLEAITMFRTIRRFFTHKPRGVLTELGFGDAVDRLSILEIKVARLTGDGQNIARESFCNLRDDLHKAKCDPLKVPEYDDLLKVNSRLWDVEDDIREVGRVAFADILGDASKKFMSLAQSVYELNDERSAFKSSIDLRLDAKHREIKSYNKKE
jgi:hypothetical protein